MARRVDINTWRLAIRHPLGPSNPTTRAVLHALAIWGTPKTGDNMFPTVELISVGSGYSRNAVRAALADAVREGFLLRTKIYSEGRLIRTEYQAVMPDDRVASNLRTWERDPQYKSERLRSRPPADAGRVPQQMRDGRPPADEGCPPNDVQGVPQQVETRPPADVQAVPQQVAPTNPSDQSNDHTNDHTQSAPARATGLVCDEDFEQLVGIHPGAGRDPRATALREYRAARRRGHEAATIIAGARRYAKEIDDKHCRGTRFVKSLASWLQEDRFLVEHSELQTPQEVQQRKAELRAAALHTIERRRRENRPVSMPDLALLMGASVEELIAAGVTQT